MRLARTTVFATAALTVGILAAGCLSTAGEGAAGIVATSELARSFVLPDIAEGRVRDALMRTVTVKPNANLSSPYDGQVVARGSAPGWGNYIAIESELTYQATSGEDATATFTVIYGNLKALTLPAGTGSIKADRVYGRSGEATAEGSAEIFIAVSSPAYDELLVIDSGALCSHRGLYWYKPLIIVQASTKWMSYPRVEHGPIVAEMVEHGRTEPEETSVYKTRCRFTLTLGEYPQALKEAGFGSYPLVETELYGRKGIYKFAQMVDADGYKFIICWQAGFDRYLEDDWELGTPITLYGFFTTYDAEQDAAVFFVRDFTRESIEEILAKRPESSVPTLE